MSVYESLGLNPIINAAGSVTRLGGSAMPRTVVSAYQDATTAWVPLEEVQAAASSVIRQVTGAEAGLVTNGAAASLTLGTAAILAGFDLAKMERLPETSGPNEIVMAREHRNGYDHAVRAAGAKIVEVGMDEVRAGAGVRRAEVWEFEAAFNEKTAGIVYVYSDHARPALDELVARAHQHQLPVLVDAAGELPPRANLLLGQMTGADLVAYSGGKAIRGPQSTGILCGRRDLVTSAALQMLDLDEHFELWDPPEELIDKSKLVDIPRHGIGRSMKVSKEEIVALITALVMFANAEMENEWETQLVCLHTIANELAAVNAACEIIEPASNECSPLLEVTVDPGSSQSAVDVCRTLRKNDPAIYVSTAKLFDGKLVINPFCLSEADADLVGRCLARALSE